MTGLYDHQGVLRFTGRDTADCLEYAELFALSVDSYCISSLEKPPPDLPVQNLQALQDFQEGSALLALATDSAWLRPMAPV